MSRAVALITTIAALLAASPVHAAGLAATQKVLAREMARAGASSGAYVVDMGSGATLYEDRADVPRMPASVEKLYTSATALLKYGADGRLSTDVLTSALPDDAGTVNGDLVIRGGGDPTFGPTAAAALAGRIVQGGLRRVTGGVIGDESEFDAFRGVPASNYHLTNEVGPLSALSYNHGRTGVARPYFQASPAQFTADALQRALRHLHVKFGVKASAGAARAGMVTLARWDSPPLADIITAMNQPSDNYIAETLLKGLGATYGSAGSTIAGAAVVRATVQDFGVAPTVVDGSGLSRSDRTSPRQVVRLITSMDAGDAAAPFEDSLPVMGRNGTLATRLRGTVAQDRCHAKTGTLHDVSALAGYCDTTGGERVAFAFMMNRVSPYGARTLQDAMTAALARYDAP